MIGNEFKTALVIPPFREGFKLESVPLNLAYLGAVLKNNGFFVRGYNLNVEPFSVTDFAEYDLIGVSVVTATFPNALKFLEEVKKANPKVLTVLGGPHATSCPDDCLSHATVDAVLVSEGEYALLDLVKTLSSGESNLSGVKNLVYRENGLIKKNSIQPPLTDLDQLPFPDKEIFDTSYYDSNQKAFGDIIASRGCPFRCTNCKPGLDHISPYRLRRPEKVVDEIEFLIKKYGIRHFTFSDSELVGPKGWVLDFCRELTSRKVRITFSCNGRTDQVSREILIALKKAGCVFIGYGVESGSQRVLDEILNKGTKLEQTRESIKLTVSLGIGVGAWFMVGIPGETWDDLLMTVNYAKTLDASIMEVNIATPWPDTGFYNICKENGWLSGSDDWGNLNEKKYTAIETPFLSRARVKEGFDLFRNELIWVGWKGDSTSTRFYHPNFVRRTIRTGIGAVWHRGLQMEDVIKLGKWIRGKF